MTAFFLTLLSTKAVAAVCSGDGHHCGCFLILKVFCYCGTSCRQNLLIFVLKHYVVTVITCLEVTPIFWKALGGYQHKNNKGLLFDINHDLLKITPWNTDFFPAKLTANSLK